MVEFRWITFSLFLMLVGSLTAVTGKYPSVAVRVGDELSLSCENVKHDQERCNSTTWIFFGSTKAVRLFDRGQIHKEAQTKSDRLSVRENCSLVIIDITIEDGGDYFCMQMESGEQQGPVTDVYLSVVTMTEHQEADDWTLNCSASYHGWCRHTVKLLYEGKEVAEDEDMTTSQTNCSAAVTFYDPKKSKHNESFECEVTEIFTGKVQQFTFSRQSSGEKTGDDAQTTMSTTTTVSITVRWRFIIVSVGLSALLISVVTVNMWTRTKENKTQREENRVSLKLKCELASVSAVEEHDDEDEDEGTVVYKNTGEPSASVRIH
ncbi:uncharacterized protein LOC115574551 [Sparus aurata]|uniref:uncharacterized protein LOC115574551 n=1 Tax=Sparus aurata TaxID=8175 RepID=UPI0011C141C8|nr:uncharacterized protein LOC115574551 [Sparus aurata]